MADMMPQGAPSADPTADPTAAAAPEAAAPDMSNGYTIEIRVTPDGKFAVGVEPMAAEDAEAAGNADEFQPVGSLGEVVKLVRDIVTNAGQMADTGADMDQMAAGYGSNT
jgi:hypothetical protein